MMEAMPVPLPDDELDRIKTLLDARVQVEGSEHMTLYERVLDLIEASEIWSDLAIRRLHEIHRLTGHECESCPPRTQTDGPGSRKRHDGIVLTITQGGINNNYVALADHLDFFPAASVGAAREEDGQGRPLTLHFAGLSETVRTDIAANHKIFRRRTPWRQFFDHHGMADGDKIAIERLSAYEYRITPLADTANSGVPSRSLRFR
jgi:hypothetical protein